MLFYHLLCFAVPCHVILCNAIQCHVMLFYHMMCFAVPCHVIPCNAMQCHVMFFYHMMCYTMPCHAILCNHCCAMLCYIRLGHALYIQIIEFLMRFEIWEHKPFFCVLLILRSQIKACFFSINLEQTCFRVN